MWWKNWKKTAKTKEINFLGLDLGSTGSILITSRNDGNVLGYLTSDTDTSSQLTFDESVIVKFTAGKTGDGRGFLLMVTRSQPTPKPTPSTELVTDRKTCRKAFPNCWTCFRNIETGQIEACNSCQTDPIPFTFDELSGACRPECGNHCTRCNGPLCTQCRKGYTLMNGKCRKPAPSWLLKKVGRTQQLEKNM